MSRHPLQRSGIHWILASAAFASLSTLTAAGEPSTPRPIGREVIVSFPPSDPDQETADSPRLSGTISLARALGAAMEGSPALASTSYAIREREALAIQAAVRPNPVLDLTGEDFLGKSQRKSYGYQQTTISIAQIVELGGKRAQRRRVADRERDLATWDFETTRVAVLTDTTRAFLSVLALQERKTLLQELERLASEMLRSVSATVRAGAVSVVEEERARVNLDRVQLEASQISNNIEIARTLLAATWGQRDATFDVVEGDLWNLPALPSLAALEAVLPDGPEIARWNAEIAQREALLSMERSLRIPNLEWTIGARHHELGDAAGVVAGINVPLPIFDRNQGNVAAARQQLARARVNQHQATVSAHASLVSSYQQLANFHRVVTTLRDQIVPRADRVFAQTKRGYATGLFRYVEVLDAQRTLFEARRELLDGLLALHMTATDLERLTGHTLAELERRSIQ